MKIKLLLLFLFCYTFSYAQSQETTTNKWREPYANSWALQASVGTNIDLIREGSTENAALMGNRNKVAPAWKMRLEHLFSRRFGWYADLQMNFYKERKSEYIASSLLTDVSEELFEALFWPVSVMRPSVNAGILYRIESNRWNVYPALGLGYTNYLPGRNSKRDSSDNDNQQGFIYKQHASPLFLNFGLSANYFVARNCFLALHADYQQPLQQSYARLIATTNGTETDRIAYKTTTAGRMLNITFGIGLLLGR